ncbi:unnamed protein product, partial [marine sediment metagenome]
GVMQRITTPHLYFIGGLHYVELTPGLECVHPDIYPAENINVNVWLALSTAARDAVVEALDTPAGEYTGPVTETEIKIFRAMLNRADVQKLFKTPTMAGKTWHLFSLNFTASAKAQTALDYVAANRPGHFVILGAWRWNGTNIAGYEPHAQLVQFMPADVLADVDLRQSQQPRQFT